MIPVRGLEGRKVAVLGLGRSGLATARALEAGGAEPLLWDDSPEARAKAEGQGFTVTDLTRERAFEGVALLVTSPGIPHLYPAPNPVIARAMAAGVPVDNDIGLFFRSFATRDWDAFDQMPRVVCVTGSNGKSTTTRSSITSCRRPAGPRRWRATSAAVCSISTPPAMARWWCWSSPPTRPISPAR